MLRCSIAVAPPELLGVLLLVPVLVATGAPAWSGRLLLAAAGGLAATLELAVIYGERDRRHDLPPRRTSKSIIAGTAYQQNLLWWYSRSMETIAELPLIGGSPALDFVNTAEERGHADAGDVLTTVGDLRAWGVRYGILDETATCPEPAAELTRAIAARELLYRLWSGRARGETDDAGDLERLTELAADALRAARPRPGDDGRLQWRFDRKDLASVRHVAVTSAVELLTHTGTARLKQCPGDQCGWFFLDTTKRGNRRWCSMSDCGQAAKTAERRRRSRR